MLLRLFFNLSNKIDLTHSIHTTDIPDHQTVRFQREILGSIELPPKTGRVSKVDIFSLLRVPYGKFLICIENAKIEKIKNIVLSPNHF